MRSFQPFSSPWITVFAVLLIPALLLAQSFRGSIRGSVKDASGALLSGAKVTAKNNATGLVRETKTAGDGAFIIAELPAGVYSVLVEAAGLAPVAQNVVVNVGLDTTADFDVTDIQKHVEALTVTEAAPIVDAERDVLGEIVDRKLITELPLNGRDFGKLVALVPGATVEPSGVAAIQSGFGQFTINGNRDRSNNYTLDGTDNNDPFFNNSAFNQTGIGGAPASLLPIDAIQEFNLQSHFAAEYGRNSGSVVNIITRSGTNQIHGSVFEFLRNDALDARNYFNRATDPDTGLPARKSPFRNNNFGASVGGPIIEDRTFFFGAYEGQRERVTSDFALAVPTQPDQRCAGAGPGQRCHPEFRSHLDPGVLSILGHREFTRPRRRQERRRQLYRQDRSPVQFGPICEWTLRVRAQRTSFPTWRPGLWRRFPHREFRANLANPCPVGVPKPALHFGSERHQRNPLRIQPLSHFL